MRKLPLGFNEFVKQYSVSEALAAATGSTACIIAASNESEKKAQEEFICEVSMMDPTALDAMVNDSIRRGASLLSKFDESWKIRQSQGLDKGPLKKVGKWYVGEGAWRINSAKANHLQMTPNCLEYYDPMQKEILEKYFEEDYGKSNVSVSDKGELLGFEFDKEEKKEKELVASESLKYIMTLYEASDDFTLGPPASAKNAVVVDIKELEDQLVDNFFLETRENIMVWGAPGIGKTEVIKNVANRIGAKLGKKIPVSIVTLATKAAYDIAGLPLLVASSGLTGKEKELQGTVYPSELRGKIGMDFAYPAWLPPSDDTDEGILFFDEINRADVDVMGAALTLLLDRRSGSYTMPDGWRIWAAGNRDMDGPVKPFEGAMASRFLGGHFHLVPTVESWSEWARSDKGFFKGTSEWYIPTEFISFLKLRDVVGVSKEGAAGTVSSLGKTYRVKFNYFYDWDEAASKATRGGKMEGFPTPRTWAKSFSNVYQKLRNDATLMSEVSQNVDPRMRVVSMFGIALLDSAMSRDIAVKMSAVVGVEAADAFITFAKQLAKLNDANGTLVEKVENVYTNPKGARPLLDIPKLGADEIFGVLNAVEGKFDELVSQNSLKTAELVNWMKYLIDLEDDKKASKGELTQHITVLLTKHALAVQPLVKKDNKEIKGDMPKTLTEFSSRWKQLGAAIKNL